MEWHRAVSKDETPVVQDVSHSFNQALGPTQPPVQWAPGPFLLLKAAGAYPLPLRPTWRRS